MCDTHPTDNGFIGCACRWLLCLCVDVRVKILTFKACELQVTEIFSLNEEYSYK